MINNHQYKLKRSSDGSVLNNSFDFELICNVTGEE